MVFMRAFLFKLQLTQITQVYKQSVLIGGVIVAVAHDEFKGRGLEDVSKCMNIKPVLVDAGGLFSEEGAKKKCFYYKSS